MNCYFRSIRSTHSVDVRCSTAADALSNKKQWCFLLSASNEAECMQVMSSWVDLICISAEDEKRKGIPFALHAWATIEINRVNIINNYHLLFPSRNFKHKIIWILNLKFLYIHFLRSNFGYNMLHFHEININFCFLQQICSALN